MEAATMKVVRVVDQMLNTAPRRVGAVLSTRANDLQMPFFLVCAYEDTLYFYYHNETQPNAVYSSAEKTPSSSSSSDQVATHTMSHRIIECVVGKCWKNERLYALKNA
ncbi:hypothetical protein HETIRDRAFT_148143 [Heterobasidion irregulare TC 32-1]|uniref:Uncharacterized protein n=1 Tax=Heterobasidion irregulare (strain TC 32-1) TaxID=747525 RepID=W4JT54_HETIT|nr:uncharacterized protein HETIRDRAFT_148143 [Heterobasidion irregulare TC 32-1]ETW76742.1 hypothetical protein HETIRDRAFT_148143 [Heterobasidion irregulare TC 32-1]